jgi:hypothetical protein
MGPGWNKKQKKVEAYTSTHPGVLLKGCFFADTVIHGHQSPILQPLSADLYQQLTKGLPGLQRQTGAASLSFLF